MDNVYIFAVISLLVGASEFLVRRTWLKHIGSALLVIILTAVVSNIGLIPSTSTAEAPVAAYDFIFGIIAPLSIFFLLLNVNLREVLKAGVPILSLFVAGSVATVVGVLAGMVVVGGPEAFGNNYNALGGMFVGTYVGGSVNFNAVALHYDMMSESLLFGGAVVVDNIVTAVWIAATLAIPRIVSSVKKRSESREVLLGIEDDTESIHPLDLGILLGLGLLVLWISDLSASLGDSMGVTIPSILVLTTIALILAHIPVVERLQGSRTLGMYTVYVFLAVIGAFCDLAALGGLGSLGISLLVFTFVAVAIHGLIVFGLAVLFKVDLDIAAVASQANVGGGTSALALARSLGRNDLVLPAVLIGSLGLALGTYLGFWAAGVLLPMIW
ncbi:MAG: DUF819 family protein [Rhodothermales bacterium]|nr:DUF819 family protein [Rhodothermales bacterium]